MLTDEALERALACRRGDPQRGGGGRHCSRIDHGARRHRQCCSAVGEGGEQLLDGGGLAGRDLTLLITESLTQKPTSPGCRQPLTAFETHSGRSALVAGTAQSAPYGPFIARSGASQDLALLVGRCEPVGQRLHKADDRVFLSLRQA